MFKVYIKTYGCQMNEFDSEVLEGFLEKNGFGTAPDIASASVVILNTCNVRETASQEVVGKVGELRRWKEEKPGRLLVVCGCLAENMSKELMKKAPWIDLVAGPRRLQEIPEFLKSISAGAPAFTATGPLPDPEKAIQEDTYAKRMNPVKAWVVAIRGCSNFCSYCVVPYARGPEVSREPGDIIAEAKALTEKGYREITLLGQNVNAYGLDLKSGTKINFAGLLRELDKVDGLYRIRFMTSHPKDMSLELIEAIRDCGKVCEHIHLPVQSGSDRILKAMNRKYDSERYSRLIADIRRLIPDVSITTDIIAGFPGETEEDFEKTIKMVKDIEFDAAFTFKFSARQVAAAAKMPGQVDRLTREKRLEKLIKVQSEISRKKNESMAGTSVEVLAEKPAPKGHGDMLGRTRTNKTVIFKGEESLAGQIVNVRVESAGTYTLFGFCDRITL